LLTLLEAHKKDILKNNIETFNETNFKEICTVLSTKDNTILQIINSFGIPPLWKRPASFTTLIKIILEQQVSLASAKAAFTQLQQTIGDDITPEKILALSNDTLKNCYFSKQKIVYVKDLSNKIISKSLCLENLELQTDEDVKQQLIQVKGIGNWSATVFLMMALNRCSHFPIGDIALINSIKVEKNLPKETSIETIEIIAENWKPYKTIASYIFWWSYLNRRGIQWQP